MFEDDYDEMAYEQEMFEQQQFENVFVAPFSDGLTDDPFSESESSDFPF